MLSALRNIFESKSQTRDSELFHSRFGGLWIDRVDAHAELARRLESGQLSSALGERVKHFMDNGFVVLEGAVPVELVDRLASVIATAYAQGDERLLYHTDGTEHIILQPNADPSGKRIIEAHAVLAEIREALSTPAILEFLKAIFEEAPVLTQSLTFQEGSQQGLHQDTAYVVYNEPLKLAASWIALEDIEEGSGELRYVVKSHRLPDFPFSNARKDSHGVPTEEVNRYLSWLSSQSAQSGLQEQTFLAKKGDALIWHADLAHGGAAIKKEGSTRQSLVGHYCPASVLPKYERAQTRRKHGPLTYSTYLYDLNELD